MDNIIITMVDSIAPLFPLLSVVLGGLITYLVTTTAKKTENKQNAQLVARDTIWIPFCSVVEDMCKFIGADTKRSNQKIDLSSPECTVYRNAIFLYLDANKRIYLQKKTKPLLEDCYKQLQLYDQVLKSTLTKAEEYYRQHCMEMIEQLPFYKEGNFMDYNFSISDNYQLVNKLYILKEFILSSFEYITGITFIQDDNPDNYENITVNFDNAFYHDCWYPLECGDFSEADLDLDDNKRLAILIAEQISERIYKIDEDVRGSIDIGVIDKQYKKVIHSLDTLHKQILEDIDNVSNW